MRILGFVGPIASGKGVLGQYLKGHGYLYYSLSDRIREYLSARGVEINRTNLINTGNFLRQEHGLGVLAQMTIRQMDGVKQNLVFDSIRNLGEIEKLREAFPAIMIIGIDAPEEIRLKRFLERAKNRREDGVTEADFWVANARDRGESFANGQQVDLCLLESDLIINNPYDDEGKFIREASREIQQKFGFRIEAIEGSKIERLR